MQKMVYVVGDVHGQFKKLTVLLQKVGLIADNLSWTGKDASLWFLGDLVDRGPDGIPVIDLVMQLQTEAALAGGQVQSLLGNHEMLFLAAYRFGRRSTGLGSNFISRWKQNGGNPKDLKRLTLQHLDWLANRPVIALIDDHVLLHADAAFYLKHGRSIEDVNASFKKLLSKSDSLVWEETLEDFARRGVFSHTLGGEEVIQRFLTFFGGRYLVHGHTPISSVLALPSKKVTGPLIYADGRCINVDGGMFLGGLGFVYQLLPSIDTSADTSLSPIGK